MTYLTAKEIQEYLETEYQEKVTTRTVRNWMRDIPVKNPNGRPLKYPKDQAMMVLADKSYFDKRILLRQQNNDIKKQERFRDEEIDSNPDDPAYETEKVLDKIIEKRKDDLLKKLILVSLGYSDFDTEKMRNDFAPYLYNNFEIDGLSPEEYQNLQSWNQMSLSRYLKR